MKQLQESILDSDFSGADMGFIDSEFINEKCFERFTRDIKNFNAEICIHQLYNNVNKVIQTFDRDMKAAGHKVDDIMAFRRWGFPSFDELASVVYDGYKRPFSLQQIDIPKAHEYCGLIHSVDEFMSKNVKNWAKLECTCTDVQDEYVIIASLFHREAQDELKAAFESVAGKKLKPFKKISVEENNHGRLFLVFER